MIEIIPAIDIMDGKCVRLESGDFSTKKIYSDDPVQMARDFQDAGLKRLHLVDLDGTRKENPVNIEVLYRIAEETDLKIDFGGGIKSNQAISDAFEYGASQVTAGSIAVRDPELVKGWIHKYGAQRIILGADVRNLKISVSGWTENSGIDLMDFLNVWIEAGIQTAICTDISKDGMLTGPSFDIYRAIRDAYPKLKLIASGGVTGLDDLETLNKLGVYGAIVGKAFYEGRIKLEEIRSFYGTKSHSRS